MSSFAGTKRLVKLAVRRDRIKLPVWILIIVSLVATSAPALQEAYPSIQEKTVYASTTAPSVVAKFMGGIIDGPSLGAILMVETFLFTAMLMAFMSVFAITRHTRANEETGSAELISSGVVGRYAPLSASLIVVIATNIVIGLLIFASLFSVKELSTSGSLYFSSALALTGIVFAAIAAVCVQLTDYARAANALAASIIGVFFVVRGIGDGLGGVSIDGLSAQASWPSWLSPFGWSFQVHPYTQANIWLLGSLLIAGFLLVNVSFVLLRHRDIGSGIFPSRPGRAEARQKLLSAYGLAIRLQRSAVVGWSIAFLTLGGLFGVMAKEFEKLFTENEAIQTFLAASGSNNFVDLFFSSLLSLAAIIGAGFVVQSLSKMRSEESSERLESLMGTSLSRQRWMFSHVSIAVFGAMFIILLVGLGMAASHMIVSNVAFSEATRLLGAAFVQLPVIVLFSGIIALFFAKLPRAMVALSWAFFVFCIFIGQFALLLKLPSWTVNLSPFSHTPLAPANSVNFVPLAVMTGLGLLILLVSHKAFSKRDIDLS